MTGRPRLLDLFSGAGGAAAGYWLAGFEVVGVDHVEQPRYPFAFVLADALEFPLDGFDAIHASPPCQRWSRNLRIWAETRDHPDHLTPTLARLRAQSTPWVIENVPGAPLPDDAVTLCGSSFGLDVRRHRLFATSWTCPEPPACRHDLQLPRFRRAHTQRPGLARVADVHGHGGGSEAQDPVLWRKAMGVGWMTPRELVEAVPPAYTTWLGGHLLDHLEVAT